MSQKPKLIPYLLIIIVLAAAVAGVLLLKLHGSDETWLSGRSINELKQLAQASSSDPLPHLVYGERLARNNRAQDALDEYQRAFQMLDSDRQDALALRISTRMGYHLASMGDDERARLYLDRAGRIDKGYWLARLGEGVSLLNKNDAKGAEIEFRRAVALQPQSYEAHYYLAVASSANMDDEGASRELKRAIAIAPEFAPAHAELGRSYVRNEDFAKAAVEIREARRLDPGNSEYLVGLAKVLCLGARSQAEYEGAANLQDQCVRSTPNSIAPMVALGQLHYRFMNLDKAYDALKRVIDRSPNNLIALYTLARVAELKGDRSEAQQNYASFSRQLKLRDSSVLAQRRVATYPKDPRAHLQLARSYHDMGNLEGCYQQLRAALALRPDLKEAQAELSRIRAEYESKLDSSAPASRRTMDQEPFTSSDSGDATLSQTEGSADRLR